MQFPPLPDWFWYPITFIYGAIVGSFLNVVIYRVPLHRSVWGEGSHCPNCNTNLRAWDNVPILAFLFLRGRCRYCHVPISWRYMTVELLTACIWVALYDRVSTTASISWVDFVFQALFASVLVAMVFIDLDHFIAPDELNVIGFVLALGRDVACLIMAWQAGSYVWQEGWPHFAYFHFLPRAIPGAIVYGGLLFAVSVLGFVYYAREPGESASAALRRYVDILREKPEETEIPVDELAASAELPEPLEAETIQGEAYDDYDDEEPPRLRTSPGFLAAVSAVLLATVCGAWGLLALIIPALSFVLFARRTNETPMTALRRFFNSDEDDNYARADAAQVAAAEEADEFAREAETGAHGGMGLGDVKLALAIGALLGPVLAILSLLVATMLGAFTGIAIAMRRRRRSLRYGVPFVPFMAAGAIVTMLYGTAFLEWYGNLISPPAKTQIVIPPRPGGFRRSFRVRRIDGSPAPAPVLPPPRSAN